MAATSVLKVLESVNNSYSLTKTLTEIEVYKHADGSPLYHVGNNTVIFKIKYHDEWRAMRCYTRRTPYIEEVYGDKYLREELYVYRGVNSGEWIDVVLEEWVEGVTLREVLECAIESRDMEMLHHLSNTFDCLAHELLSQEWAHGDLTAENIIVTPTREMRLIDFDCKFLPHMRGRVSAELGTAAYQPPSRSVVDFDCNIDDYSIALISTALRAISIDVELYDRYPFRDGLLFDPELIRRGECEVLERCCEMFLLWRMPFAFRVATLLKASTLRIPTLKSIFACIHSAGEGDSPLHLTMEGGYIGYSDAAENIIIPHIYDDGLEFQEGVVMVRLAHVWMSLNTRGEVVASFEGYDMVKSKRGGVVRALRDEAWEEIVIGE